MGVDEWQSMQGANVSNKSDLASRFNANLFHSGYHHEEFAEGAADDVADAIGMLPWSVVFDVINIDTPGGVVQIPAMDLANEIRGTSLGMMDKILRGYVTKVMVAHGLQRVETWVKA